MQRLLVDLHDNVGLRDWSRFLHNTEDSIQLTTAKKNEPTLFDFNVVPIEGIAGWALPERGMSVRFEDDRWSSRDANVPDGVVFTGYVTAPPVYTYLGKGSDDTEVWVYALQCTSEDYLINLHDPKRKVYVNRSRGYILRDMLREMFAGTSPFPFNLDGVLEGGTERLYQVDGSIKWTQIAAEFAKADGYIYHVFDHCVFYQPEAAQPSIIIDRQDARFNPSNLDLRPVNNSVVNDLTVIGLDEPGALVKEYWLSDGYTGAQRLAFLPYGLVESALLQDDFASSIDQNLWVEVDEGVGEGEYIQAFEGALNVIGGTGTYGETYLLSRKGIELTGLVETRDGELYFPPTPTGEALLGGFYTTEVPVLANLWCGWKLDLDRLVDGDPAPCLWAIGPSGVETATPYPINLTNHHYVLRRQILTESLPAATSVVSEAGKTYDASLLASGAQITWTIDDVDMSDVNDVITTRTIVLDKHYATTPPSFVLYGAVSNKNAHCVLNSLLITRPSQIQARVDGTLIKVGNYLDGGRASVAADSRETSSTSGSAATFSWYAVPGGKTHTYYDIVLAHGATSYWRLGEQSGDTAYDSGSTGIPLLLNWGHTPPDYDGCPIMGVAGAITDQDTAMTFPSPTNAYAHASCDESAGLSLGKVLSVEVWAKTSSLLGSGSPSQDEPLVDFKDRNFALVVYGGDLRIVDAWSETVDTGVFVADDVWHHIVYVHDGTNTKVYVDGVERYTDSQTRSLTNAVAGAFFIARSGPYSNVFHGSIDEVALYKDVALTAAQVKSHYVRGTQTPELSEVVTTPKGGAVVAVSYRKNEKARARVQSATSIATERQRFRDDGLRQRTLGVGDVTPTPRTTEECSLVALAYLADNSEPRWEGSYRFLTKRNDATDMRQWPRPGDLAQCTLDLPSGAVDQFLPITNVTASALGSETYEMRIDIGPVNRFEEAERELYRRQSSSLEAPEIKTEDILVVEAVPVAPADPGECAVVGITNDSVTVRMTSDGTLPAGVEGYEVRRTDSGWGTSAGSFVGYREAGACVGDELSIGSPALPDASFTISRRRRDGLWYIKPYTALGVYSRRAATLRVVRPLVNALPMTVTGTLTASECELIAYIPRDPDFMGVSIRRDGATGPIVYEGDGVESRVTLTTLTTLIENSKIRVTIPNTDARHSMTFRTVSYNLAGEEGPETLLTVTY